MEIVTINAGSSSLRLAAFRLDDQRRPVRIAADRYPPEVQNASTLLNEFKAQYELRDIGAIAYRVVHGGALAGPCLINSEVEATIEQLAPFAPLHNPRTLALIAAGRQAFGARIPQVALFDTDFYRHLPDVAHHYALPSQLVETHHIRRYGFHGLAHQSMHRQLASLLSDSGKCRKVISLQLGSGCSVTAIRDGQAIDTSMGFSPLEGLMMATRCGDIDAGLLLYLQRNAGLDIDTLDTLLNRQSGLLGVSGVSNDIRQLLASEHPSARLAIQLYCYRARKYIGAYMAALGGVDAIVFGGGVGEHMAEIRAGIVDNMGWCGIALDEAQNQATLGRHGVISKTDSGVTVAVTPVDEESLMAEQTTALLRLGHSEV